VIGRMKHIPLVRDQIDISKMRLFHPFTGCIGV
jgi:hypothetical protein